MREKIDCFLPYEDLQSTAEITAQLRGSKTVQHIFLLVTQALDTEVMASFPGCQQITVDNLTSSNTLMSIAENAKADYALLQTKSTRLTIGDSAMERMLRVASDADAAMVYADHYDI